MRKLKRYIYGLICCVIIMYFLHMNQNNDDSSQKLPSAMSKKSITKHGNNSDVNVISYRPGKAIHRNGNLDDIFEDKHGEKYFIHKTANPDWFKLQEVGLRKSILKESNESQQHRQHEIATNQPIDHIYTPVPHQAKTSEQNYFKRQKTKVNPYKHGYTIRNTSLCDSRTEMLIIVHSFHPYVDRREAIRATWGSFARGTTWPYSNITGNVKLVFILGLHNSVHQNEALGKENEVHKDIIMGNFTDSYKNMTLKSLLGLKYFFEHCSSAKYLLKSDDDMFINLPYLIQILRKSPIKHGIMGPLNAHSRVYRGGKWAVPYEVYPFKYYPPFEAGAAYVISADITRELFETAEYVESFSVDDAYITGILGRILNVTHIWQQGFAFWTSKPPKPCELRMNFVVTGTKMTPALLTKTWKLMKTNLTCQMPPADEIMNKTLTFTLRPPLDKP